MNQLETDRLILRHWKETDRPAFAGISADPEAMQYLGGVWNKDASDAFIDRANKHFAAYGYGIYALQLKHNNEFIGFAGLKNVTFDAYFTPAVEIGWRLGRSQWNKGYATEAAKGLLDYAFFDLKLDEVISYVTPKNISSIRVMEKLGMQCHEKENFRHPMMNKDDPLSEMVLYRIKNTR